MVLCLERVLLNFRSTHNGKTLNQLLKMAALAGIKAVVQLHIRRGDNVNATDDKGRSPLLLAASRGHTETCRILLEAGADPRAVDKEGNDALSIAMGIGNIKLVSLLREHLYPPPKSPCEEQQENEHLVGPIPVDDANRTAQDETAWVSALPITRKSWRVNRGGNRIFPFNMTIKTQEYSL